MSNEPTWQEFHSRQKEVLLPAGTAVPHLAVKVRYVDESPSSTAEPPGKTILLMHGIPTWGYLYHAVIPPLVQAGYRIICPDFLGHGYSDKRDKFDRSFQDQARMVVALLKHLEIPRVHVVGHDTGGAVALILGIEHGALVDRLVITNSVCYDRFDDDMLDFGHPLRWKSKPMAELQSALEESVDAGLHNPDRNTAEFKRGILAPWCSSEEGKLSLLRNASALNANQTMALVDRHGSIQAEKTMILWGLRDPWQKAEDGRQLAREIPRATFVGFENASHWIQQDTPVEFTNAVLEFLA